MYNEYLLAAFSYIFMLKGLFSNKSFCYFVFIIYLCIIKLKV